MADELVGQRHWLIKVDGIDGFFSDKTGGNASIEVGEEFDGGADVADQLDGRVSYEDLTVTRPYKRGRDGDMLRAEHRKLGKAVNRTITAQETDGDGVKVGKPIQYFGRLKGVNDPEANANASESSKCGLVFKINRRV